MPHSFGIGLLVVLRHPSGKRPHGLDNDSPIVFNIRQKKLLRDSPTHSEVKLRSKWFNLFYASLFRNSLISDSLTPSEVSLRSKRLTKVYASLRSFKPGSLLKPASLLNTKKEALHIEVLLCWISGFLSSQGASPQVLSAFAALTAVFGMGTGGSPQLSPLNLFQDSYPDNCIKMFVLTTL